MTRWLGENPLHTLLVLTEKPGEWAPWQIAPLPLLLAATAGLIWGAVTGGPALGWAVALGLLALALADWALLASLPRWGLSFGVVQPPFLGLVLLRWLLILIAAPLAARWPLPTLIVLALVQALGWVLAAYGLLIEPFRLQVTHLEIPTAKFPNPGSPVRIVQISDLHVERLTRRDRALPALVAGLKPDLIVLTGDFLSTSYNDDPRALADLRALLGQFAAPYGLYAVWGTAEVDFPHLLRPVLDDLGIVVLEDQAVEVAVRDQRLWLMGLPSTRDLEADGARLRALLEEAPPGAFSLLLYHMPDLMPHASALDLDLMLSGHTHGGQWRVPGFGAILTSSRFWKRYEGGHYLEGDTHLYVSRGLGLEGFGTPRARFFCPPELVLVTLVGARASGARGAAISAAGASAAAPPSAGLG
jgi:predicted MPP superfamily phosphohydrolase